MTLAASVLAGNGVCVCVDGGNVGVCTSAGVHVTVKRRLFAGMENAKISRCCWTIHFILQLKASVVCV